MENVLKVILSLLLVIIFGMGTFFVTAVVTDGNPLGLLTPNQAAKIVKEKMGVDVPIKEIENEDGKLVFNFENNGIDIDFDDMTGEIIEEDDDAPITGNALKKASDVALQYIGKGRVTDSEINDEDGFYEIEITLDNGHEVDVHLDRNFIVIGTKYD